MPTLHLPGHHEPVLGREKRLHGLSLEKAVAQGPGAGRCPLTADVCPSSIWGRAPASVLRDVTPVRGLVVISTCPSSGGAPPGARELPKLPKHEAGDMGLSPTHHHHGQAQPCREQQGTGGTTATLWGIV